MPVEFYIGDIVRHQKVQPLVLWRVFSVERSAGRFTDVAALLTATGGLGRQVMAQADTTKSIVTEE